MRKDILVIADIMWKDWHSCEFRHRLLQIFDDKTNVSIVIKCLYFWRQVRVSSWFKIYVHHATLSIDCCTHNDNVSSLILCFDWCLSFYKRFFFRLNKFTPAQKSNVHQMKRAWGVPENFDGYFVFIIIGNTW